MNFRYHGHLIRQMRKATNPKGKLTEKRRKSVMKVMSTILVAWKKKQERRGDVWLLRKGTARMVRRDRRNARALAAAWDSMRRER